VGLFGGIFKAIGKVAKAGASALTHGASDQVLKVLKGRGQAKQVLAKGPTAPATQQDVALVTKRLPVRNLMREASVATENAVLNQAGKKAGIGGFMKGIQWKTKRKRSFAGPAAPRAVNRSTSPSQRAASAKRSSGSSLKPRRSLPPALRARANAMSALAARWRAEGKPGRWIEYVKANL